MFCFFFFKQKTAYEMRISDWSSDVCSSDLNSSVVAIRRHASAVTAPCTNTTSASRSGSRRLHAPLQKEGTGMAAYHFASSSIACRRLTEMGVEIGRASCRERVLQYVSSPVVAVSLKKKIQIYMQQNED